MARILTVCTGNICRSPAAELLLHRDLGHAVTITSAGTHALVGGGIPDEMLDELEADGIDGTPHTAQQLTERLIMESDAIITMTREHRQLAVQRAPVALRKTFTIAELAAAAGTGAVLTGTTIEERLAQLPATVGAHRHILAGYELDDVPDPFRRSRAVYAESYALIRQATAEVAEWIVG